MPTSPWGLSKQLGYVSFVEEYTFCFALFLKFRSTVLPNQSHSQPHGEGRMSRVAAFNSVFAALSVMALAVQRAAGALR